MTIAMSAIASVVSDAYYKNDCRAP